MVKKNTTAGPVDILEDLPNEKGTLSEEAKAKLSELSAEPSEDLATTAKHRTTTGKISKVARDAQNQLDMIQMLSPTLGALNELAASRWPEMRHTDEELEAIVMAASKVMSKYADDLASRYTDEIILAVILGGSLTDKGLKLRARLKEEAKADPVPVQGREDVQAER